MAKKKRSKKTTKVNVNVYKRYKIFKLFFVVFLILFSIFFIIKIEEDLLHPFGINEPNLNFHFFTSSECISFHPLYISLDGQKGSLRVSTSFDKLDGCIEKNFIIDVDTYDAEKYIFKINDVVIEDNSGNILLENEKLKKSINALEVEINGVSDYYNYYAFKSEKSKIEQIEFNVANRFLCEGNCIGIRRGNVIDTNYINGRSVTYRVDDSEVMLIFLPKNKYWNYMIILLHGLIAGLFLLLLQKLIFGLDD